MTPAQRAECERRACRAQALESLFTLGGLGIIWIGAATRWPKPVIVGTVAYLAGVRVGVGSCQRERK